MQSILECPICISIKTSTHYYLCTKGHSICQKCKNQVKSKCPQCRSTYNNPPTRNYTAEEFIKLLLDSKELTACSEEDCNVVGTAAAMEEHAEMCAAEKKAKKKPVNLTRLLNEAWAGAAGPAIDLTGSPGDDFGPNVPYGDCPMGCRGNINDLMEHMSLNHVECRHDGCNFTGRNLRIDAHERDCEFGSIECRLCGEQVPIRTIRHHNREDCDGFQLGYDI